MGYDDRTADQQIRDRIRSKANEQYQAKELTWWANVIVGTVMVSVAGTTQEAKDDLNEHGGKMTSLQYGQWIKRWKSKGFLVDGVAMTNLQMHCFLMADGHEAHEKFDAGQCCGDMPDETNGQCGRGLGLCPLVRQAGRIIHEETGE